MDAERSKEIHKALSSSQFRLLGLTARSNWKIGDKLPFDGFSVTRLATLNRMQHRENELRISILLPIGGRTRIFLNFSSRTASEI